MLYGCSILLTIGILGLLVVAEFGGLRKPKNNLSKLVHTALQDGLYRNSIYLIANMCVTAVTGFGFWTLNAHLFKTADVGYATTLISILGLAGLVSSLGFGKTLIRFLAKHDQKNKLIATKLYISAIAALASSVVFAFLMPRLGIKHTSGMLIGLFIVAGIVTTLKALVDSIFISFRASGQTLLENSVTNISRLILPFAFLSIGYVGIFISYTVSALLGVAMALYLLVHKFNFKLRERPSLSTMQGLWSFSIGSYMSDIVGALPSIVLPIIITAKSGPTQEAYWYMAMQIITFLFLLCSSVNQSLFAEAAHNEAQLMHYVRRAAAVMFGLVISIGAILFVCAPLILSIFGHAYDAAVVPLRLLVLSSLLVAGNYVTGSILSMYRKVGYLTFVNAANAAVVLGMSLFTAHSLSDYGWAWLAGEVVNITLFGSGALYVLRRQRLQQISKKQIAIDGRYLQKPGMGINIYLKAVLRLLLDEGFAITVIVNEMPTEHIDGLDKCRIIVSKRNRLGIDMFWEQWSLARLLYKERFSKYLAPGNTGLPLFYFGKTRLILTVHDLIPFHFASRYIRKQPKVMVFYYPSQIISLFKANSIVAVSQSTADDIRRLFHRKSTPVLLPLRYMQLLDTKVVSKDKRKKQFVYNGGVDPRKNAPLLIEAFAAFLKTHSDYTLLLMGNGYERYDQLIQELGIASSVRMLGYVSHEEKMRILAQSTGVVYPSLMEGYGLPIVEAFIADVPVICGTGGAQREVGQQAATFLESITAESIAESLKGLIGGKNGHSSAKAQAQLAYLASPIHEQTFIAILS